MTRAKTTDMEFQNIVHVNIVFHVLGVIILKLLGWKVEGEPPTVPKFVCIVAPHTSYWDYPLALFIGWHYRMTGAWLGKEEMFRWPLLGWFFRKTGGLPVDRNHPRGMVGEAVRVFGERDHILLALAPEGTRAKKEYWKSGFYHIAVQAGVPISLGYLDFKRKAGGFGPLYYPTGDVDTDLAYIRDYYAGITPRNPEWRSDIRFR